ncbi:hypothetical protein V6N12_002713 [Hibiscus sabdariffa]|uniref:Uncharacterized protein n=1 Tax=Hibiscus sabdariffa TaxID=183260 RepID=A0ABR2E9T2_9ROSI
MSIETFMSQKTANALYYCLWGQFAYNINFCPVDFHASAGDFIGEHYSFIDHEMSFFPIEYKICFFASGENFFKIVETASEVITKHGEIIHKDLHEVFIHIGKNCCHASLKSGRGIA